MVTKRMSTGVSPIEHLRRWKREHPEEYRAAEEKRLAATKSRVISEKHRKQARCNIRIAQAAARNSRNIGKSKSPAKVAASRNNLATGRANN